MGINLNDPRLTPKEIVALKALTDLRGVYEKHHRGVAAHAVGVSIFLLWQVFTHIDIKQDNTPV